MPPGIVLEILVDDKGSPVIKQFDTSVSALGKDVASAGATAEKAATGTQAFTRAAQAGAKASTEAGEALRGTDGRLRDVRGRFVEGAKEADGFTSALLGGAKEAGGFTSALLGGAKAALALTAGVLGIQGGIAIVQGIGRAFTGFEDSLANVNTLIPKQTALQATLRQEILRLPPALGDAKTLAGGLYAALSAGVKPAQAVEFVGVAAKLARAGLADMDTTITALTKTMAVYGFDASEASRISDVFFQVVNVGQGTLKQFAGAFPDILVAGKALGVNFEDNAAALATLSAAFRSPEQAATGLVSLFSQITTNADEFLRRGINIREVIAEKGLAGAIDALRKVTGGTSTELQKFVGDIQGQQAALTLMNSQYDTYIANTVKVREQSNSTGEAFKVQTKTLSAAVDELGNATDKLFQGPGASFIGQVLTTAIHMVTEEVLIADQALNGLGETISAATLAAKALNAEATAATAGFTTQLTIRTRIHQEFIAMAEKEQKAQEQSAEKIAAAYKGLGETSTKELRSLADGAVRNLQTLIDEHGASVPRIEELWQKVKETVLKAYGALPPALAAFDQQIKSSNFKTNDEIKQKITETYGSLPAVLEKYEVAVRLGLERTAEAAAALFKKLGVDSKESLQDAAIQGGKALGVLVDTVQQGSAQALEAVRDASGKILLQNKASIDTVGQQMMAGVTATTASIVRKFHETVEDINKGELDRLPSHLQDALNKAGPIVRKATGEIVVITRDAFGKVRAEIQQTGNTTTDLVSKFDVLALSMAHPSQQAEALRANFRALTGEADGLEGSIEGLSAAVVRAGHSFNAAGVEVNAYGNALAETTKATQQLMDATTASLGLRDKAFAKDREGLLASIREQERHIVQIQLDSFLTLENKNAIIASEREHLAALHERLKALEAIKETTDAITPTGGNTPSSPGGGGGGGGGSQAGQFGGGGTSPTTPGAQRPLVPDFNTTRGEGSQFAGALVEGTSKALADAIVSNVGHALLRLGASSPPTSDSSAFNNSITSALLQRPHGNVGAPPSFQRFANGGIVQGSGGIDSQVIFATPGERVQTPAQQAQDRAISISFGNITIQIQGGPAASNPLELGRIAAQAFIREMAPALNESLARGGGRFA